MKKVKFKYIGDSAEREVVSELDNMQSIIVNQSDMRVIVYRKDGMITYIPINKMIEITFVS
jgi:hypothetical protein